MGALKGLHALIVDDNQTNGHILEMMLSKWGIVPSYVADGASALAHLEAAAGTPEAVALLLVDGEMPTMDGFMLVEQVRRRPGIAETPVIMLTSAGRPADAARCQELRVQRYLLKPVRPAQLRDAILEVFGGAADQVAINGAGVGVAAPVAQRPLRIVVADDNVINQTILKRILEKLGHAVTLAANGQETFDIVAMGSVRPRAHGRADAGHGRPRVNRGDPQA